MSWALVGCLLLVLWKLHTIAGDVEDLTDAVDRLADEIAGRK